MDRKKIIAGVVLGPVFLALIIFGTPLLILAFVLPLAAGLGSYELSKLIFPDGRIAHRILLIALSLFFCLAAQSGEEQMALLALCAGGILVLSALLFIEKDLGAVMPLASKIVFGAFYVGMFSGLVVALKRYEVALDGTYLTVMLFTLTWSGDSGAYFAGKMKGKHKLWPRVSAGKTWEGLVGGFLSTVLIALFISAISSIWTVTDALVLSVAVGVFGPIGDLVVSAAKRGAGVKDSGIFMPGHGGVLDRIDSVLFTAPIIYFYAVMVGPIRLAGLAL